MALSNPYQPQANRVPGTVGNPLPGVTAALLTDKDQVSFEEGEGQLLIKSECMFDRYLNKPEATAKEFHGDWFMTGDYVSYQKGVFKILGRISQDIIKKAGYKISALDIESVLLQNTQVKECCVFGVPDVKYGEEIVCVYAGDING